MNRVCCECKEPLRGGSFLMCADCRGLFHYPDPRIPLDVPRCGVHEIGFRNLLGWDAVPLCLRCDMAFRLQYGIPS